MREEMEYEFAQFKADFEESGLVFGRYMDESEYEYDYSHNEIYEYMEKFIEKVKEYLHEKAPGRYVIYSGWCVFVMTVEEARVRDLRNYAENIVV